MTMSTVLKSLAVLSLVLYVNCAPRIPFSKQSPKLLGFTIEMTDSKQQIAADSLGAELARRFIAYGDENGDFRLVKPGNPSEYAFKIRLTSFNLITMDSQVAVNRELKKITGKYDRINDSILDHSKPGRGNLNIAGSLAATAALNILLPQGWVGYILVRDSKWATPTWAEQRVIDSLTQFSNLGFSAELSDRAGKKIWMKNGIETIKLDSQMSEKEQLFLLVRNTVMNFEGKMPFLKLRR
jgi:hypothetical protein